MKYLAKEIASTTVLAKPVTWDCYLQVLNIGLQELDDVERRGIFFRFWKSMSIAQVAAELKVEWTVADQIINHSVFKLKKHFAGEDMKTSPFCESKKL